MPSTSQLPPLAPLMRPRSIAVLGASPRPAALGNTTVQNLLDFGFGGKVYPVHPSAGEVAGVRCYAGLRDLPEVPDCAVVALSADKVVPALEEAAALGVRAAVVFASGFAETGAEGRARQDALADLARRTGLRVCGPNCLGLVNIAERMSMYSASLPETIRPGGLAVISHSGSGCIVISNLGRFGFSYLVSAGNCAVVDMAEYLEFLAADEATRIVALFMESIRDPEAFARAVAAMRTAGKPVVVLKVGRSERGAAAAAAHTGALAGSQAAYRDFFRRHGVIAVDDLDELAESVALMLSVSAVPRGDGLGIVNVSGGEIALTCDLAQALGVRLPALSEPAAATIRGALPAFGHATNPLDVTGTGVFDMKMYAACVEGLASDPDIAMVAVSQDCPAGLGSRQAATYRAIAQTVAATAARLAKPLAFFSNVAGGAHPAVAEPLHAAGVPLLQGTRTALLAIRRLFEYGAALRTSRSAPPRPALHADSRWRERLAAGAPFTERESKRFLADCGIAVTREALAATAEEAAAAAERLGFPVALKIESPDISHKSEAGGVRLDLRSADEVADAFRAVVRAAKAHAPQARIGGALVQEMVAGGIEVIAGLARSEPFGAALVVGSGGVLVELVRDSALALAPVGRERAKELIDSTRIARLLAGYRGAAPGDEGALLDLLVKLSDIALVYGDLIQALDLNPVAVLERGLRVLDALLVPRKQLE